MSDPYRRSPRGVPARHRVGFRLGRTLAVVAVALGSVTVHALDVGELRRTRELQLQWSEVATCFYGAPLAEGETPASRVRRERIAAAWRGDKPGWPLSCRGAIDALAGRLDPHVPAELRFRTRLTSLAARREGAEHDDLFGAARALGLGHAVAVGPTPPLGPVPAVMADLPALHRGVSSLEHVATTPVRGRAPAILLASDAVPRICRWTTESEPLDTVSCWDVPDSVPPGGPRDLRLMELASPGGPLLLQLQRPGRSQLQHFDARTGAPVADDVVDTVARRSHRPSSSAGDCGTTEGSWDEADTALAFEPDAFLPRPDVVLDRLGNGRQIACGRGDEARVTGIGLEGPDHVTVVDARCRGDLCSEERLALRSGGPPRADLLREDGAGPSDAAGLGAEIVVAMAHHEAGVVVRRAPMARLDQAAPSLLIDDLDAPTRRLRLVTDGRGVVLLLDDGHLVRALRQRPDGSWAPQVATAD